jgi:hypothetical protein
MMRVLNKFEPKEVTNFVNFPKCAKQLLDEFPNVMPKELYDELPLKRQVDHAIEVMSGLAPPAKAPYRMNNEELEEFEVQLEELPVKGYIKPSKSPYEAHVVYVHKEDETLRMCVEYITFSRVIMRNQYPLLRIDDLFD